MADKLRIIARVIGFCIVFIILFLGIEIYLFEDKRVSTVWETIQQEGEGPDILFMGNSHMYTSTNPILINHKLGIDSKILGSSAQNMVMTKENLKVLLEYQKPDIIVLEPYAALIDNREVMQTTKKGFVIDNLDGIKNYAHKLEASINTLKFTDLPEAMFQLCRPMLMWSRWEQVINGKSEKNNPYQQHDMLGYVWRDSYTDAEMNLEEVQKQYQQAYKKQEPYPLPDYNELALREFFEFARDEGIDVWIIKAPTAKVVEKYVGMMKTIEEIGKEYGVVKYIDDMHLYIDAIGLKQDDFYDLTHLNRRGAMKFTEYLIDIIAEQLNLKKQDDEVFFYKNEYITQLENGKYRYTMENYQDVQYKFELYKNKKIIETQDFSNQNYFDTDVELSEEYKLTVTMLPKEYSIEDKDAIKNKSMRLNFMQMKKTIEPE